MLQHSYATRFFLISALVINTGTILTENQAAQTQNASQGTQQTQYNATELATLGTHLDSAIIRTKNSITVCISILQKYGKSFENLNAIIESLRKADDAHNTFIAMQLKSVAQYNQQDPSTIPAEAYREMYGIFDLIIQQTSRLLEVVNGYIKSNFKTELDYNFLLTKDMPALDENISAQAIIEHCNALATQAELIDFASNSIGLTTFNKACQAIDRNAVQPFFKYHVPEILLYGGGTAFSAVFLYWLNNCKKHTLNTEKAEIITRIAQLELQIKDLTPMGIKPSPAVQTITDTIEELRKSLKLELDETVTQKTTQQSNWLTDYLSNKLGDVPAWDNTMNQYSLRGSRNVTWWNKSVEFVSNCLGHNPIINLLQGAAAWAFKEQISTKLWPAVSNAVRNWWQRAQGGRHAEMSPVGTFVVPADKVVLNFDHVVGLDHIKDRFKPAIEYARNPQNFAQIGGRISTNYVLYGIKRTGKSHFANALAGEMIKANPKITYLKIPCAMFRVDGVEKTIDYIRSFAPCIAFIDEIDIGGFNRAIGREPTGDLLMALGDGNISPSPDRPVFLVFATNKLEALDTSLTSWGRFGANILFTAPSFIDRISFIQVILQQLGHNPHTFDIERLAEKTDGNSFEEIQFSISAAMVDAKSKNKQLSTELILAVMNEMLHGLYPEVPYELHPETVTMLSVHFAGRALATILTQAPDMLDTVSICKRKLPVMEDVNEGFTGKPARHEKYNYGVLLTRQATTTENMMGPVATKAHLVSLIAGAMAEELILGKCTHSCEQSAMSEVYGTAIHQASDGGMIYYTCMAETEKSKYFEKAQAMIDSYKQEARELLTKHRQALEVTARALRMFGTLHDGFVQAIIENPESMNAELEELERRQKEEFEKLREQHMAANKPQETASIEEEFTTPQEAA